MVNHSDLPVLKARRLLRRINEIQSKSGKFGWSPTTKELNLKEFVGGLGITYYDQKYARDSNRWIGDLYSVLNRTDILCNFTKESSVGLQWAASGEDSIRLWNLLRQIVLGWELKMRLETLDGGRSHTGFTDRILSTLIISDLWLKHIEIILVEAKVPTKDLNKPETEEEKAKADSESFTTQGNDTLKKGEFQKAVDLYTDMEAMKIDLTSAIYRSSATSKAAAADVNAEVANETEYGASIQVTFSGMMGRRVRYKFKYTNPVFVTVYLPT